MSDYEEKKSNQKNEELKTEAYTNLRACFLNFPYFSVLLIVLNSYRLWSACGLYTEI